MIYLLKSLVKSIYHKIKQPKAHVSIFSNVSLDCKLDPHVRILQGAHLGMCTVDRYTYIGKGSKFAKAFIGPFCSIGQDVICGLGNHPTNFVSTYPGFYSPNASGAKWFGIVHDFPEGESNEVYIGADVWIGSRAIIMGGIKIGHGVIIAAGAVVTKDVPSYSIVGGVPAKIIRYRFEEEIRNKLLESKWWKASPEELKILAKYANQPLEFVDHLKEIRNAKK